MLRLSLFADGEFAAHFFHFLAGSLQNLHHSSDALQKFSGFSKNFFLNGATNDADAFVC